MGFQRSLSDSDRDRRLNPHPEANTLRAVPRQLYLPRIASNKCCRHSVAQGLLAYPATKCEELGRRRRKDPLQRIDEPDLGIHPSGVLRLIDTRCDSPNSHYVNHSVRGFRPPGSRRISSARFGPSRLRMRRIIRPRVVAPAIKSTPDATHSVATITHRAFSLAGTILIPDCAPPMRLSPALFPKLPPAPICSCGRSRP